MITDSRVRRVLPALAAILFVFACNRPAPEVSDASPRAGEASSLPAVVLAASAAQPDTAEVPPPGGEASAGAPAGEPDAAGADANTEPRFALIPESARPGEPITVGYSLAGGDNPTSGNIAGGGGSANSTGGFAARETRNIEAVLLDSRGRRLTKARFFDIGEGGAELKAAVLAVPSTAVPGNAVIRVESAGGIVRDIPFMIETREFKAETIHLNQQNTEIRTAPDPQKTAESEQLWAVISRFGTDVYSGGAFTLPVESTRRTSAYGSRRIYQYSTGSSDTTIHAGVDIGIPTGTRVSACAAGKVVLAKSRIVTGNTVILEHLPGVYSLYYHLDSIAASEGSAVEAGAFLGESGSTGLATGPHLHWEIRVAGENADPDAFLARPVLDKKAIFDKLTSY